MEEDGADPEGFSEDDDPLIAEIREIRRKIFERCGNDPARLVEYYMERQEQFADRLIFRRDAECSEEAEPGG